MTNLTTHFADFFLSKKNKSANLNNKTPVRTSLLYMELIMIVKWIFELLNFFQGCMKVVCVANAISKCSIPTKHKRHCDIVQQKILSIRSSGSS